MDFAAVRCSFPHFGEMYNIKRVASSHVEDIVVKLLTSKYHDSPIMNDFAIIGVLQIQNYWITQMAQRYIYIYMKHIMKR